MRLALAMRRECVVILPMTRQYPTTRPRRIRRPSRRSVGSPARPGRWGSGNGRCPCRAGRRGGVRPKHYWHTAMPIRPRAIIDFGFLTLKLQRV